jgi:transposase
LAVRCTPDRSKLFGSHGQRPWLHNVVKLVYYPPYHSKYNLIERCWGILENHWNGTLLKSIETVVGWARTMTWKGAHPVVHLLEKTYEKGVRITKAAFKAIERRLQRDKDIPKYDILIQPRPI